MLLGTVEHPEQLGDDLLTARRLGSPAGQLLEEPGVAEPAAGDHHGVGPGLLVGAPRRRGALQAAGDDHRHVDAFGELAGQCVVRLALVAGRRGARVEGNGGDPGVSDQP